MASLQEPTTPNQATVGAVAMADQMLFPYAEDTSAADELKRAKQRAATLRWQRRNPEKIKESRRQW